ncbi:MAG TPA: DoxX family protein [Polyangiaceae bacterium]|jgi:putative oxidoreductase
MASTASRRPFALAHDGERPSAAARTAERVLPLAGRILYSLVFLASTPGHFSAKDVASAAHAGVPIPHVLVPIAGILALVGGLSVLFGFKTKIGAWLLIAFLVPVTLWMHRFWGVADPHLAQMQMINFMKNTALIGAALYMAFFGAGPLSIDHRSSR